MGVLMLEQIGTDLVPTWNTPLTTRQYMWFNKQKKQKMEVIQNYVPTSKAQLIQMAMYVNNGDLHKAQEMFDFYAKNLELPDFDPVSPTFMQQFKANASGIFSWIKENQGDLINGYQFIQSIIKNKGALPTMLEEAADGAPLPPINE